MSYGFLTYPHSGLLAGVERVTCRSKYFCGSMSLCIPVELH
jgi:hypothetical protein